MEAASEWNTPFEEFSSDQGLWQQASAATVSQPAVSPSRRSHTNPASTTSGVFRLPPLSQAFGASPPASPQQAADITPGVTRYSQPGRPLYQRHKETTEPSRVKRRRLHEDAEVYQPAPARLDTSARHSVTTTSHSGTTSGGLPFGAVDSCVIQAGPIYTAQSPRSNSFETRPHGVTFQPTCCSQGCKCKECGDIRSALASIVLEAKLLDVHLVSALTGRDTTEEPFPNVGQAQPSETLFWLLNLLRNNNARLEKVSTDKPIHTAQGTSTAAFDQAIDAQALEAMKRSQETQSPPNQDTTRRPQFAYPDEPHRSRNIPPPLDETWRDHQNIEPPAVGFSPHRTASAASSVYMPSPSPRQAPAMRMLPSPTSMNISAPPSAIIPLSTQGLGIQPGAAHTSHLQDLQHQVSVKTLALQTLQREYDSLIQKLERQRVKSAALEKKFEVTDVEINALTDEKERLQAQVTALEKQVEELTNGRDQARRDLAASGSQYMKIVEMASQLQAQGAEEKRKWEMEKEELASRIRILEAGASGNALATASRGDISLSITPDVHAMDDIIQSNPPTIRSNPSLEALREEVLRLQTRNQTLENTLRALSDESKSMQEAARAVAGVGERIKSAINDALDS